MIDKVYRSSSGHFCIGRPPMLAFSVTVISVTLMIYKGEVRGALSLTNWQL